MSSPDQPTRRAALLAVALLPTLVLGGCFRPMYASTDNAAVPGLTQKLASIDIAETKDDRTGQLIRNKLSFYLSGGGDGPEPRYRLGLASSLSVDTALIDALADSPEVDTVTVTCDFALYSLGEKKLLFRAKGSARKSYDRGLQRFAAIRALQDAQDAAADVLADQIRTRLAIYFAEHPNS